MAHIVHVELGEQLAGNLAAPERIKEDIPFVRISQTQGIRTEKYGGGDSPRPTESERIHGVEHALFDGVKKLKLADHFLGTERLERQFAARFFDDAVAPILEDIQADASRP
jgi:hypothetical protein